MPRRNGRRIIITLALVGGLAACGTAGPAAPAPTVTSPLVAECPRFAATAKLVSFGVDGAKNLLGMELGTGTTGIVLAHQYDDNLCTWMGTASVLAERGYRALAFDFNDFGVSAKSGRDLDEDVAAAAAFLRSEGATSIVLIGASMGGAAVVVAAATITPPVTAVVELSGPSGFGLVSINGAEAARRLTMPVLYEAAENDNMAALGAQAMYDNTPKANRELHFYSGTEHGVALVIAGGSLVGLGAMNDFLAAHAPPTA